LDSFENLDPDSPEYEAAVMAAQDEEDRANGNTEAQDQQQDEAQDEGDDAGEQKAEADPEGDDQAGEQQAESTEAKATEEEAPAASDKVAGVLSKNGERVLPYSALQAERNAARRERQAREERDQRIRDLEQENADLKAGKSSEPELTDEELEAEAADNPVVAKLLEERKAMREQLEERASKEAPKTSEQADENDPAEVLQSAIDSVPLLSQWQYEDPEKFKRAVAIDNVMRDSPKWKGKEMTAENMAARFRAVTKQVAQEYDIEFNDEPGPDQTKKSDPKSPAPVRQDPKKVIDKATRSTPSSLSDFKGGTPDKPQENYRNLPGHAAVEAFGKLTDAEIEAHLARTGGD
jgi:hypothetical protein